MIQRFKHQFAQVLIVTIGLLGLFADVGFGKPNEADFYTVVDLKGDVWTRTPHQVRWQRVSPKSRLRDGQLLQVTYGAAITLKSPLPQEGRNNPEARSLIRLTMPVVVRLSADMMREVRVTAYATDDQEPMTADFDLVRSAKFDLGEAWHRVTKVFTAPPDNLSRATLSEMAQEGMALGQSAKKIAILSPVTNSVVHAERRPVDLKVMWAHPKERPQTYKIYVWPAEAPRGQAVAKTDKDFYTVQLPRLGVFLIQIMSSDGGWQSPAHVVHAVAPPQVSSAGGASPPSVAPPSLAPPKFKIIYPPENTTLLGSGEQIPVDFAWRMQDTETSPVVLLSIMDSGETIVHQRRYDTTQARVSLAPGRYSWYLSTPGDTRPPSKHALVITSGAPSSPGRTNRQLIVDLIRRDESGTVILGEGL